MKLDFRKVDNMTNAEFTAIESKLKLKLPAVYRKTMSDLPAELLEWPSSRGDGGKQPIEDLLVGVDAIVKAQKAARKRLEEPLEPGSFVVGRNGENFWVINTEERDPAVELIIEGLQLSGHKNLAAFVKDLKAKHMEAWAKAGKHAKAGATATMSADALIAEGRRMARPAVLLVDKGKEYAAVWRGTGVVPPPKGEWEHAISIDARFLPNNPRRLRGVMSVSICREDSERFEQIAVTHDPKAKLPAKPDGQRLFTKRIECVPSTDALFRFGSKQIQDWLKANSVDPKHPRVNPAVFGAPNQPALKAYLQIENAEHPFWGRTGAYAMLGGWGWAFLECYGVDEDYPWEVFDMALVLLTLQDEPWVEVFDNGKKFVTYSRIS